MLKSMGLYEIRGNIYVKDFETMYEVALNNLMTLQNPQDVKRTCTG